MGVVTRWRTVLASALVAFGVGGAVLLTPATVSAGPPPPSGNLILNGNFATINETVPNDGYLTVNAGDPTTISDWTVDTPSVYSGEGAGSVDVVSSGYNDWGCDGSNNCIDLAGTPGPPGGLYQDVTTTIGEEYSLSFASAVNGDEATGISHTMGVTVTGVTDDTVDASDVVTALSAGAAAPVGAEHSHLLRIVGPKPDRVR